MTYPNGAFVFKYQGPCGSPATFKGMQEFMADAYGNADLLCSVYSGDIRINLLLWHDDDYDTASVITDFLLRGESGLGTTGDGTPISFIESWCFDSKDFLADTEEEFKVFIMHLFTETENAHPKEFAGHVNVPTHVWRAE